MEVSSKNTPAMNATTPISLISDLQTGCEFIASIPLTNPEQAEVELKRFLDGLLATPPDGETYFRLLEHARISIDFVAEELAKRYLNKPLPLSDSEEAVFQQVEHLWLETARAYAHCAENDSPAGGDPGHVQRVAMILHRCIHHTGMAIKLRISGHGANIRRACGLICMVTIAAQMSGESLPRSFRMPLKRLDATPTVQRPISVFSWATWLAVTAFRYASRRWFAAGLFTGRLWSGPAQGRT